MTISDLDDYLPIAHTKGELVKDRSIAKEIILNAQQQFEKKQMINWGILHNDQFIGYIGFYRGFENATGEIGYAQREEFRGNGYMSEAVNAVVVFGFDQLKLDRITAYTEASNSPSVQLLLRCGFNNTGELFEKYTIFDQLATDQ